MDFATILRLLESSGYKRTSTKSSLIIFDTTFIRGSEKAVVNWRLGGYVSSISMSESGKIVSVFDSVEKFIESLS